MFKNEPLPNAFPRRIPLAATRTHKLSCLLLALMMVTGLTGFAQADDNATQGETLYQQAQSLEEAMSYTQAMALYNQALPLLEEEGKTELAQACGAAAENLAIIQMTYPLTFEELKSLIAQAYPEATDEQIDGWIADESVMKTEYDGAPHYFSFTVTNLKYHFLDLMYNDETYQKGYAALVEKIDTIAGTEPEHTWQPYQNPVKHSAVHTISIPRDELPDTGTIRLWLPIPINTEAQTGVTVDAIEPEEWVKQPPSTDQDVGVVYMEIPLDELTDDLSITVKFSFTHYEQRFSVDVDNVGEYDQASALYQQYTSSDGNTEITPEIRAMARQIVGDETNPYLAARKIYDYIVNHVEYCLMPHSVLWPRTELTESAFVYQTQRGDCGSQSIYFSALCRAVGIPARSTGGWQLFGGVYSDHFWAEFYLPNYGWLPVDTSFAQLALFVKDLDEAARQTYIDYYFGNQDVLRCTVQKDTDEPLIPKLNGMGLLPLVIQEPVVEYTLPTGQIMDQVFTQHWTLTEDSGQE